MKNILRVPGFSFLVLLLFFSLAPCKKKTEQPFTLYTFIGDGSGSQVIPAVQTNATAIFKGNYSVPSFKFLSFLIDFKDLSSPLTKVSLYGPAPIGKNAKELMTVDSPPQDTEGRIEAIYDIRDSEANELLTGQWYYVIHTVNHQDGELRGQILKE